MRPWREIINPHKDVLKGEFQQSEFSADLTEVFTGNAKEEYQNPVKFFERTYITEGMRLLLGTVIKRITGRGGDPVIELQTNFGGGKTHSLLAVYHLATREGSTDNLGEVSNLLDELEIRSVPRANCAVIDGNSLSPNQAQYQQKGLTIKTMWGLLAWQLLGQEGYDLVAQSDEAGTAPGKPILTELLQKAAPCVILMDELVAYIRQFENKENLSAGTFGTNISFIQNLTESVKAVDKAILLVSLPQSDIEAGGEFGIKALKTLEKFFGRVESIWKPVATDEGFEIVRRRLFEKVHDEESMNAVCEEFMQFYRKNKSVFPPEVQMEDYLDRMKRSYPIHPEIFDRLYKDWSTLEKFQSTRGVLQLMASVIYQLWKDNDQDALIMPGSIPQVKISAQNSKYLSKNWNSIIEEEIDGENSTPAKLDNKEVRFGSIHAAQRITRTIFLGSAPDEGMDVAGRQRAVRGLRKEQILLGCAVPKQTLSTYDDALARLRDQLHYLFTKGTQYWFDTRPNLRREMECRKDKIDPGVRENKLRSCAKKLFYNADSLTVYIFPNSNEVPEWDQDGLQLVIFPPQQDCVYDRHNSKKLLERARNIIETRGEQARNKRNRIIFLVPGSDACVRQLNDSCGLLLAWEEIQKDSDSLLLNLDSYQKAEVKNELEQAKQLLNNDFKSCYTYILVPVEGKQNQIDFEALRLESNNPSETIVSRVAKKLKNEDYVIDCWNSDDLYNILNEYYFRKGKETVSVETIWTDFCKYLFYPRLLGFHVLRDAILQGIEKRLFGLTTSQTDNLFSSFTFGQRPSFINMNDLIIAPEVVFEYEQKNKPKEEPVSPVPPKKPEPSPGGNERLFKRFYATTDIPSSGGIPKFEEILDELVVLLNNQVGVNVKLTLTIEADSTEPFNKNVVRVINENCKTMGINGFFDNN